MPRFFVSSLSPVVTISGGDASHIARSLRMKPGEPLTVCDGNGMEACGVIRSVSSEEVIVSCGQAFRSPGEPPFSVTLYQACPKGDKLDLIVQKAVELGVSRVVLVLTSRCISRPDQKDVSKKLARYQKIAAEAAGQCGRGIVPCVEGILTFDQAIAQMSHSPLSILFYEKEQRPLRELLPKAPVPELSIFIGSEGGFSEEEAQKAASYGIPTASLGSRILRCETAPIAALAALMYHFGEI